jgi:hypothetical protein
VTGSTTPRRRRRLPSSSPIARRRRSCYSSPNYTSAWHKLPSHRLGRGKGEFALATLARDAGTPRQRSGVKPRSSEQGEGPTRISIEKGFEFPKRELQRDLALGGKFAGALAVVVGIGGAFLSGPRRRTR